MTADESVALAQAAMDALSAPAPVAPWCDCPPCPGCGRNTGIVEDHGGAVMASPLLYCPACGHEWDATPEDRAQAERAQTAWEEYLTGEVRS